LLVALNSQGVFAPVIVIAHKGMEGDLVQAFRLGATDYLIWPVREAEVVAAVERVLKQVRARRERETLARQLKQTNDELQQRVRELTTIFAIGKAVTSITHQRELFEKIVEGAIYVSEADCGWLLLREERTKVFRLVAQRNLPKALAAKINQPWEDGISSMVAVSGETLAISGGPLAKFKVAQLGQSILVVPIKLKKEVMGLLVVVRKAPKAFSPSNRTLLEAVADYASISLVNARLFRALEERARSLQQAAEAAKASERKKAEMITDLQQELVRPLAEVAHSIDSILAADKLRLNAAQKSTLQSAVENLHGLSSLVESLDKAD
jgi:two-component system NtrC family sensor kinase